MIYVTGDMHADAGRLKSKAAKRLKKNDTLIVCGDFGFIWDGSKREQRMLKWLGKRRYQVLFVEGTHDNFDLLADYPEVPFAGGRARQISGRCYQLLRGEVYTIESDKIFTFGGGESDDMDERVPGKSWWPQELPTPEELTHARENLEKHGNVVDYIITHQASPVVDGFLQMDGGRANPLASFFSEVSKDVRFKCWFSGARHMEKVIPPRYRIVYQDILPLKSPV